MDFARNITKKKPSKNQLQHEDYDNGSRSCSTCVLCRTCLRLSHSHVGVPHPRGKGKAVNLLPFYLFLARLSLSLSLELFLTFLSATARLFLGLFYSVHEGTWFFYRVLAQRKTKLAILLLQCNTALPCADIDKVSRARSAF